MFRVDLLALERSGRLPVKGSIEPSERVWEGSQLPLDAPVEVLAEATMTGTGQVVVRGTARTTLGTQCSRCLDPIRVEIELPLALVWSVPDELDDEDSELRVLDPKATELEVGDAVREELILAVPAYPVCRVDCRGLCPRCGGDRNEVACECKLEEPDPRWEALRSMKTD